MSHTKYYFTQHKDMAISADKQGHLKAAAWKRLDLVVMPQHTLCIHQRKVGYNHKTQMLIVNYVQCSALIILC